MYSNGFYTQQDLTLHKMLNSFHTFVQRVTQEWPFVWLDKSILSVRRPSQSTKSTSLILCMLALIGGQSPGPERTVAR